MQIIGAGFGRTGTMSLKLALERLGYKPCYHMLEVLRHPSHIKGWLAAGEGKPVDWEKMLAKFQAGVDFPLSPFYQELMAVYPEAKVILTVRDPQQWYESTRETIYKGASMPNWLISLLPTHRHFLRMVRATVWERLFQERFEEREYAIQRFNEWITEVKGNVPAERLLVFDVKEGWEPLCRFLGNPIPDKPFPRINQRKMTLSIYAGSIMLAAAAVISLAALVIWLAVTVLPI